MNTTTKKILIIEDDPFLGSILKQKLVKNGYDTTLISDGAKGLEEIKKILPDLILLDIILPTMNGYEILEEKQKDAAIKDIPVIVVSNSGQPVEISRVISLGVKDYLVKAQFDPEEVLVKVKAQLNLEMKADGTDGEGIKGKKILWIEDDLILSDLIGRKLSLEGCTLIQKSTGEQALSIVEAEMPDVIILDIILPAMSGIEVLEKLKQIPSIVHIPVIMLSNLNERDEYDKATKLGAVRFLTKATLSLNEVISEIRLVLQESVKPSKE